MVTYTYAILDVPGPVYAAVRALLSAAGYDQAFHQHDDGEVVDMHGIALRARAGAAPYGEISVGSLVSRSTGQGRVELQVGGELAQMDLDKARSVLSHLAQAIEAAISDELLVRFLKDRIGLEQDAATAALGDFREMRQGSRGTVVPS